MDGDEGTSTFAEADPVYVRFRDESRFWIQRVLLPIIGTVGIFGNIATILVLTRRGMRTSTNAYLTALAVADLIYLICVLWLSLRHYPNLDEDPMWSFIYAHVWPYTLWITDATTNTSVWLTVTFTVERCIAIANPIKGRVLCTVSRAKKVIIIVYLLCFTTSMTTPFEWTVEEYTNPWTNTSVFETTSSTFGEMKIYKTIYYWFTSIIFVLVPLGLLIIFNFFLIKAFRQSQKLRQIMTARQKVSERDERATRRELKITSTLITVVVMFIVCQLPTAATLIYEIFHVTKLTANEEAVLRALGNIFNCLVALNAACNFILYCTLSDKYRQTFMITFFPWIYQPPSSAQSQAFLTHQVDGPKDARHITSRRQSSFRPRKSHALEKMNTQKDPSLKFSSRLQRNSSSSDPSIRPKANCYIMTLPIIPENGSSSEIFTANNNSSQTAVVIHQHFSPFPPGLSCYQSIDQPSPSRKNTKNFEKTPIDSTLLVLSSWPNIFPCYKTTFSKFHHESESKIRVLCFSNAKDFPVTSCSV